MYSKRQKKARRESGDEAASLPLVDDFQFPVLQKVTHLGPPGQDGGHELPLDLLLLLLRERLVPLLQSDLALPAEQQHVLNLLDSWGGGAGRQNHNRV